MAKDPKKASGQQALPPGKRACEYEVGYEARELKMVAKCKECGGRSTLKEGYCLSGIINSFSKESGVDTIILSHFIETQYNNKAIELIRMMTSLAGELTQLANRDPTQGMDDGMGNPIPVSPEQRRACEQCRFNPAFLYPSLRDAFVMDIEEFYRRLNDVVMDVGNSAGSVGICGNCISTTLGDLNYIYDKFEELVRYIVRQGYQIVL